MAKRLQVVIKDAEYRDLQRAAHSRHMSIAEWVRQVLGLALRGEPQGDVRKKIDVIRAAARLDFPTADIQRMLAEIEIGHRSGRALRQALIEVAMARQMASSRDPK